MKNFDNLKLPELFEEIVRVRAETEAIKFETQAIKKHGEEAHNQRVAEIDAIRKENDAIRKENDAELKAMRQETEAMRQENDAELKALRQENDAAHNKRLAEVDAIRIENDAELKALRQENERLSIKVQNSFEIIANNNKEIQNNNKEIQNSFKDWQSKYKNLSNNIGSTFEESIINGLMRSPVLNKHQFDKVFPRMVAYNKQNNQKLIEVDAVLINASLICIVEIKHAICLEDVIYLHSQKLHRFKECFIEFNNYQIMAYLAGGSIKNNAKEKAKELGIGVLKPINDIYEEDIKPQIFF